MAEQHSGVPRLSWKGEAQDRYQATDTAGVLWSIDRHPTPRGRQGKNEDWSELWWLHRGDADQLNPEVHDSCPVVTSRSITALHRHPSILRYADVLAAGWWFECWRIPNGQPDSERVMRRGDDRAPLSALLGEPVMVHPQLLLNAELERNDLQRRAYAAEAAVERVRRLCELTIAASCRVQAIEQARDTLAVLDGGA
ncbi:hypothetical protein [Actinoallomurus sp. CA-142502]|uniref:hypothetical protein n=1 Tax=Actinoallomurus sp. CA-142502 TaxID=3239885 RepID=UPI003D8D1F19